MDQHADAIGAQLARLGRLRERTLRQHQHGDIDPATYVVLFRLLSDGPMRSGALADAVYSDPSTVSRQIAHLVQRGLVERRADADDGRVTVLAATDAGRARCTELRERRAEMLAFVVADWPTDDLSEFLRLLTRFVDDFEARRPDLLKATPA